MKILLLDDGNTSNGINEIQEFSHNNCQLHNTNELDEINSKLPNIIATLKGMDIGKTLEKFSFNIENDSVIVGLNVENLFNLCYEFYKNGDIDSSESKACLGNFKKEFEKSLNITL